MTPHTATSDEPVADAAVERSWTSVYSVAPQSRRIQTAGTGITVSIWEALADNGHDVVLVHGGAAGRQWWDHLVPLLRGAGRVVALDLSGHGDSGRRDRYTLDAWAAEVRGVAGDFCDRPPVLVGHSMGGIVAVHAAQTWPNEFAGVMALDSPLRRTNSAHLERRNKIASRPARTFGSHAEAVRAFKTAPPSTDTPSEIFDHVAHRSYRELDGRWTLKYDPHIYFRPQIDEDFVGAACIPTWWIRAEHGFVDDAMAQRIRESIGPKGTLLEVPAASHHMILEQPMPTAWVIGLFLQQLRSRAA